MSRRAESPAASRRPYRLLAATTALLLTSLTNAAAEQPVPLFQEDINLQGSSDNLVLPFIVPPGQRFDRATLDLAYSNALAVLPDQSGLDVSLNGKPLATLPLIGAQGPAGASIELPASAFVPGRNEFRFQTRQTHRLTCSRDRFEVGPPPVAELALSSVPPS